MWSCNPLVVRAAWRGRTRIPEDHIDWSWYPQTRGELPGWNSAKCSESCLNAFNLVSVGSGALQALPGCAI